uniref:tRNA isopentenyl-2-thiomethyl-A-37 hydroxylase MiaE n=1 Tax=Ningiella ruwaisensis TaxID=2364274 RepID=UPI00109F5A3A|nr:tRNA isopentenyl-2-thiomethyl-A-37 hydroxylase MiaE [Ningiella ruwaisensis]
MIDNTELLAPVHAFLKCETPKTWINEAKKPEHLSVLLTDHLICELKAAQSAMFLIRRYAVDEQSASALLEWLAPFEHFAYRKEGDWRDLKNAQRLSKTMIPKAGSAHGQELINKMVLLIKEELHHFFQVLEMMQAYNIEYENISSSRYARGLLKHVRTHEPAALIDKLICGALIEARSCERFAAIAPHLDKPLADFYISLLRSEARHFEDYLSLAKSIVLEDFKNAQGKDNGKYKNEEQALAAFESRVQFLSLEEADLILSPDKDFKFHSGAPIQGRVNLNEELSQVS